MNNSSIYTKSVIFIILRYTEKMNRDITLTSKHYLIVSTIIVLIGLRLSLPYAVKTYATNQMNKIPGYQASINDIDIHLWKGSYTIKDISLNKMKGIIPVPFFFAKQIDLSVEWMALLHGSLVAKATAHEPVLNFVIEPSGRNQQLTIDKEWEFVAKTLFPLNFNKIKIQNGNIALHSFTGKPPFELSLKNINFEIRNMRKVIKSTFLFSTFNGTAQMNGGDFWVKGQVNPKSRQPTFILKTSLKSMKIEKANNFLMHFSRIDVSRGDFSLYGEIAAKNGKITGYAKPLIKDLKIFSPKKSKNPIEFLYKGFLEVGSKIVTNQKKHTIATKIKIKGNIDNPKTSTLSIIGYILRHAFIQALLPQIDNSVEMKDVTIENT